MNCLHCGATTTNGLALCEICQRYTRTVLDVLPVYFRNLARWRPGRGSSRQVPGSRVLFDGDQRTDGTGDRISDRLDDAYTTLTKWALEFAHTSTFARPLTHADAALAGDLPDEIAEDHALCAAWLCAAFDHHLNTIATRDWAGRFVTDLRRHEAILCSLTETLVPGWYAGGCRQCGHSTYVVPGLTWVTCRTCGTTTFARDHLETILNEARDWLAPPKQLAQAVVALVDTELSVPRLYERIKKWEQRGKIEGVQRTERGYEWHEDLTRPVVVDQPVGPKRYRLGDVLDRITTEGATRTRRRPGSVPA